ncbi:ADF1 [Candida theae]|uniref:ADF1 n=1 Tax=Candida theae TaxID=1198502 RepID=A0AAD5BGT3_9ASCO|nr:ADF1 [Candida theae]KAI5960874.1 ADF1 [Candida theae]
MFRPTQSTSYPQQQYQKQQQQRQQQQQQRQYLQKQQQRHSELLQQQLQDQEQKLNQQQQQQQQQQKLLQQYQQVQYPFQQHSDLQQEHSQDYYSLPPNNLNHKEASRLQQQPQAHHPTPSQQQFTPSSFTSTNRPLQSSQQPQQQAGHNQISSRQDTNTTTPQQNYQQQLQPQQVSSSFPRPSSQTHQLHPYQHPLQYQLQYSQPMSAHNSQRQLPPQQQHHHHQQQQQQQFSQQIQHPQPSLYDANNYMYQAIPSSYQPRPQLAFQQQQQQHPPPPQEYYVPVVNNPSISSASPTSSSIQKERKLKGSEAVAATTGTAATAATATASPVETHEMVILPNFPERLQKILPHPPLAKAPVRPDITASSTAKRAKRKSRFTPEQDDLIVRLKRSGKSWDEIAEITGVGSYLTARNRYQVIVGQQGNNNSSAWDNNDKIFLRNLLDPAEFEKWRYIASELNKSTNKNFNDFEVREMVRVLFWSNPASFGVSEESIKEAVKEKKLTDKTIEQREQQRKKKMSKVVGVDIDDGGGGGTSGSKDVSDDQRNFYRDDNQITQQPSSNIYTKPY